MKCGDKNTKFFHRKASTKKNRNMIQGLFYVDNEWVEGGQEVERVNLTYFEYIFTSLTPRPHAMEAKTESVEARVSTEMNKELLWSF